VGIFLRLSQKPARWHGSAGNFDFAAPTLFASNLPARRITQ